jgi:uncharacterized protein YecE (DUF72 family)
MPDGFQLHIGTSGWHYKHWLGKFYPPRFPPAKMLSWYAREFHTVEINNSFYRLPDEKTFEKWKQSVPLGFLFAVKASRYLTHIKRLKDPEDSIELFLSRAKHLGSTLGPVLFQLPPNLKADTARLEHFMNALPKRHRYVFEFRDESWLTTKVYELLRRYNAALCLHDWRELPWPAELTANFTYIRFHGSGTRYGGNYSDEVLRKWAERIRAWKGTLSDVFIYFNNDAQGYAIANARTLRAMLEQKSESKDSLDRPIIAA